MAVLYPVIMSVAAAQRGLKGPAKVRHLSARARQALTLSAARSGVALPHLSKDDRGAPLPVNGVYWSISHKPDYVAGVVSPHPVGIDLEEIRTFSEGVRRKIADEAEWALSSEAPELRFFRFWTAKEAVLKAAGTGLSELSRCRVQSVPDGRRLILAYRGDLVVVAHFFFERHVAAVVPNAHQVRWSLLGAEDPSV
ncbi:MAG: 4'-phosphopantetheinyl transferase superfamily protein [Desulfobacterales bacterium]|nr:4'-phosphopantetheinyl transferase superfamily protein [Desulfobacterales bacterium]